jgi:hypothetical protein
MTMHASAGQELAKGVGRLVGHVIALVVGLVLMIVGVAMGVTIVMLPVGVPVGFFGLLLFLWGFFGRAREEQVPAPPPQP